MVYLTGLNMIQFKYELYEKKYFIGLDLIRFNMIDYIRSV